MEATPVIRQLLDAGVHFGHQTKRWNPKMRRYIFGTRSGIHIIDLEQTERALTRACEFLEQVAARGQAVLFVGTKKQARPIVEAEAKRAEMPHVINRWLGGTLTNFQTRKRSLDLLRDLRQQREDGVFDRLPKKEAKHRQRRLERLEEYGAGLLSLERMPGCLFIVDTKREQIAVREATRLNIPIVALCDTNADPDVIAYPIPGNDDAIRSIRMVLSLAVESLLRGRRQYVVQTTPPAEPLEIASSGAESVVAAIPPVGDTSGGSHASQS